MALKIIWITSNNIRDTVSKIGPQPLSPLSLARTPEWQEPLSLNWMGGASGRGFGGVDITILKQIREQRKRYGLESLFILLKYQLKDVINW